MRILLVGEESYVFTADDGTVWRYDTAAGDYVQQQEEEEQQQEQEEEVIDRPTLPRSYHFHTSDSSRVARKGKRI